MTTTAQRPVVLIAEELSPAGIAALGDDFEVRYCDGADRAQLLPALATADAVIVRSATKIDAEAIAAAPRLRVVARAGVGLDNVDIKAATARGVMVVNAPTSNIVSAAEHAIALLLAVARNVAPANEALRQGQWKRSKYTGVEIAGKTLGVVGLGRIGVLVAQRMSAFGVNLIAYDPYVQPARAAQLGVRLVPLEDLLRESDFITIHLPKTPETAGLIGAEQLRMVKPSVRIVNAARGGLIDEAALAEAVLEGRVAGAGVDVFAAEPTTSSPLFASERIVVTPHLGASTDEAQEKAGLAVARSVALALRGEFVADAVNVQAGGTVVEEVRPALPLVEKLAQVLAGVCGGLPAGLEVAVLGELASYDVKILGLTALRGLLAPTADAPVSYVNAPALAAERGLDVTVTTTTDSPDYRNLIVLRASFADGRVVQVAGTLAGTKQIAKVTEVDGFDVDLTITPHLVFFRYVDRPGIVGAIGAMLGDAQINIASAQVSRTSIGGDTLMVVSVDSAVPAPILDEIGMVIGATAAHAVDVAEL
ncbi:MAG: D-3-phosphoglycerate dehydrogenase [Mycobacterium sp.]|nr:D-3-phosphoglycerate dehydrogenase [Mycobacterium sp.]